MIPVFNKISTRAMIAFGHDIFMSALAFLVAMYLRLGDQVLDNVSFLGTGMLISCCVSAVVFYLMGLYRGVWRYASINDLIAITKSASLAILISALFLFFLTRLEEFPRSVPLINWFVLMALLGGAAFYIPIAERSSFRTCPSDP
jgi:FlaA1/EpsC-like NDP-sugar epimerase